MSEQVAKKYVPKSSARARETNFGLVLNVSFEASELGKFVKENKNAKGYINLSIVPRKTEGTYGETHSICLDTWEPKARDEAPKQGATSAAKKPAPAAASDDGEEPPF